MRRVVNCLGLRPKVVTYRDAYGASVRPTYIPMSRKHPVNRTNTQTATKMHLKSIRDEADTFEGGNIAHRRTSEAGRHLAAPDARDVHDQQGLRPLETARRYREPRTAPSRRVGPVRLRKARGKPASTVAFPLSSRKFALRERIWTQIRRMNRHMATHRD